MGRLRSSLKRVLGAHRSADFKARSVGLDGIHQESMVLTQWAFIGPALLWPRELGFPSNLNLLEPFLFISILVSFTLVRCFWESLLVLRLPVVYFTGSILGVMLFLCVQKSGYLA